MQPIFQGTSPAGTMTRLNAYKGKATDMLSAFLLLLAVLLAGGTGPLQAPVGPAPPQSSADAGTGSHRSAPVVSKQQLLASEARDLKAAPWDDGKPKAFLRARGLDLAAPLAGPGAAPQDGSLLASASASGFDARAPPAKS